MANAYNAVKVTGAELVGVGYSFTLQVRNLDNLLYLQGAGGATLGSVAFAGVPGSYGDGVWPGLYWGASLSCYLSAHRADGIVPPGWNAAQAAAWNEWIATYTPPEGQKIVFADGFLFAAKVGYGAPPGETTQLEYKCFGWVTVGYGVGNITGWYWTGDTEWSKPGTVQVDNIQLRVQSADAASALYVYPRRWTHRYGAYSQWTSAAPPTTWRVTLGDMSLEVEVSVDDDADGRIDPVAGPGTYTEFGHFLGVWHPQSANMSYCDVTDVSCNIGTVPINLSWSAWAVGNPDGGGDWTVQWADPGAQDWRWYNTNNDFTMQFVGSAPSGYLGQAWGITEVIGPVAWNVEAGRFADRNPSFDLPGSFKADVGLIHYTDETTYETILLAPGVSDWYSNSHTSAGGNYLNTGQYLWGTNWEVAPVVDATWLAAQGEDPTYQATDGDGAPIGGELDNTAMAICLPSVADDPATTAPEWGPALTVTREDISADIPPEKGSRPSQWVAGAGASVIAEAWTIGGDGGTITRTLLSRYQARMDFLAGCPFAQVAACNEDWPITNRANYGLENDPPTVAAVCAVEDVTNYDNSRILALQFATGAGGNDWSQARLTVTYRTYLFQDNWQLPITYESDTRFGVNGHFESEYWDATWTFKGFGDPDLDTCYFDLAELARNNSVNLQHVQSLSLWLPGPYTAQFEDLRLIGDPSEHGGLAGSYPHLKAQPAVDPWNWVRYHCGFGSTFEGMTHLNLRNGAEAHRDDVEYGIAGTQYRSWNELWLASLGEEAPSYDPTTAETLYQGGVSRLHEIICLQEQLTGSALGAGEIITATEDDEGNVLGALYMWDLDRETGDDSPECKAAMRLSSMANFGTGTRLVPVMMTLRWSTHGRGHGIAYQGGRFLRNDGLSSDDTELTGAGAYLYRRGTGAEEWEVCGTMRPDVTGRFKTPPKKEQGYQYGTKAGSAEVTSITPFVTREYAPMLCTFPAVTDPRTVVNPITGTVHMALGSWGAILYGSANETWDGWRYGSYEPAEAPPLLTVVFDAEDSSHDYPAIALLPTGDVIVGAHKLVGDEFVAARTKNMGETWEGGLVIGDGLTICAVTEQNGILHCAGWVDTSSLYYQRSDDYGATLLAFADASTSKLIADDATEGQPAIVILPTGAPAVTYSNGEETVTKVSFDGGETWETVDTITV